MKIIFDLAFIGTVLTLIVFNFRTFILPNFIIYPAFVTALIARLVLNLFGVPFESLLKLSSISFVAVLLDSLIGAFIGLGVLLVFNKIWEIWRGYDVIGMGDVKMSGMIGAYLGVLNILGVFLFSAILILIFLTFLKLVNNRNFIIPSGSLWGIPAIFFTLVNANQIIDWLSRK